MICRNPHRRRRTAACAVRRAREAGAHGAHRREAPPSYSTPARAPAFVPPIPREKVLVGWSGRAARSWRGPQGQHGGPGRVMFAHKFARAVASVRGPVGSPRSPWNQSSCCRFSTDVSRACDRSFTPHAGPQHPSAGSKFMARTIPGSPSSWRATSSMRRPPCTTSRQRYRVLLSPKTAWMRYQSVMGCAHIDFSYLDVISLLNSMGGDQTNPSESS